MRLTDLDIVYKAAKLIRDKFDIDFAITQCSRETDNWPVTPDIYAYLGLDPQLKIDSIVVKDHGSWIERIDISYSICGKDLEDGSLVDELIGGDLRRQPPNMRQTLRLAFILFDGIRYAMTGEMKKAYTDKGWRPRVLVVRRQSDMK